MSEFFFGKISKKVDPDQLTGGYYVADKNSSWFNGLQIDDYVLLVGGDKVQFWRAKEYNGDRMVFDIIINDCGIMPQKLASLIYFKLDMEFIVKSMRSTTNEKKAFFKLQPLSRFNSNLVSLLSDKNNYTSSNFRNIVLYVDYSELQKDANNRDNDIQLYYDNDELKIAKKKFIDKQLLDGFDGNIKSKNFESNTKKNKIRKKFELNEAKTKIVDISMLDFYDIFVSKQTSNVTLSNNVRRPPLNLVLYGPPGTGKTYHTVNYALSILENQEVAAISNEQRELVMNRFNDFVSKGQIVFTTFHQSMSYEDFVEGIKPEDNKGKIKYSVKPGIFKHLCDEARTNIDKRYVLIIDEINRGNVSQIFGELITLLEEDKRIVVNKTKKGDEFELRVRLPYSDAKDPDFGVPSNIYIIGTMNTADRSVEALDTALRRRFSFVEMMPNSELLKDKDGNYVEVCGAKLHDLLDTLNKRISVLKDREHQIGHSYFMKCNTCDNLKAVLKNEIIPLLQEYFYGNYESIRLVLGEGFVIKETEKVVFAGGQSYGGDSDKTRYRLLTESEWKEMNDAKLRSAIEALLNTSNTSTPSDGTLPIS